MEKKKLTQEQKHFAIGMALLKKHEEIMQERPLTAREAMDMDEIKKDLFKHIIKYGMSLAKKMSSSYRLPMDAYGDMEQAMAAIFFEALPKYNPYQCTPTTYFKPYFRQAIGAYLRGNFEITQYDARIIRMVSGAMRKLEARGFKWNIEMLATQTGLSPKVVQKTIEIMQHSAKKNVDEEAERISSRYETPEEEYLKMEKFQSIVLAIRSTLSPEEQELLLWKVNLDGERERSMQEVAEYFHEEPTVVKQRYNQIVSRLQNNELLRQYNKSLNKKGQEPDISVQLHDVSGKIVETQVAEFFSNKKNAGIVRKQRQSEGLVTE